MEISVKAYRTIDADKILHVLCEPSILKTITEDGGKVTEQHINPESACFIAAEVNGNLAAVWIFEKTGAVSIDVHAHVLPAFRHSSIEIGKKVLSTIIELADWAKKYTAQIPFCYPNVKLYAEKMGFKVEGVNSKSYLHNGKLFDQWYLGATARDIKDGLD